MAFVKGSLGTNQNVKEYTDGLEGRVDSAFKEVVSGSKNIKVSYIGTNLTGTTDAGGYIGFDIPYTTNSVVISQLRIVNGSTVTANYHLTSFPNSPVYRHTLWNGGNRATNTKISTDIIVISWD